VHFPDARIEYVDQDGRLDHVDIEVVTLGLSRHSRHRGESVRLLHIPWIQRANRRLAIRSAQSEGSAVSRLSHYNHPRALDLAREAQFAVDPSGGDSVRQYGGEADLDQLLR
jgi:hypothetical protein